MSNRRNFSAEFRAEAVELVVSSAWPIAQVGPEIGVVEGTLGTRPQYLGIIPQRFSRNAMSVSDG